MVEPRVGVLALQGDVAEHVAILEGSGAESLQIKRLDQLEDVDGLIIPGGESTAIGKLLRRFELLEPLREMVRSRFPVYGTCAGMILLANHVEDAGVDQPSIGGMAVTVRRNAFGRQRESFEAQLHIPVLGPEPLHAVFIRAPVVTSTSPQVEVLAALDDGRVVAARQGNLLASAFHPELTNDGRMHRLFIRIVSGANWQGMRGISAAS